MSVTPLPKDYTKEWTEIQGITFTIPYGVFIPRPETEQWLLETFKRYQQLFLSVSTCIDLCSGAGLISATVKKTYPHLSVISLEINPLAVEAQNKTLLKNDLEVDVRESDVFSALKVDDLGTSWILLANPPYVPEADREYMAQNNIEHEPPTAIFGGGKNGLDIFKRILAELSTLPRPKLAVFELDPRNILQATKLLKEKFSKVICHNITDTNGWHRALVVEFLI